jgi:uncharacterized membrane protein YhaH (DUF805 family)
MQQLPNTCTRCGQPVLERGLRCHHCQRTYHVTCRPAARRCACGRHLDADAWVARFDPETGDPLPIPARPTPWRPENYMADVWRFTGPMPRDYFVATVGMAYWMLLVYLLIPWEMGMPPIPPWVSLVSRLIGMVVLVGATVPVQVRRWHDLGRGALWVALDLLPGIGLLTLLYKAWAQGTSDLPR